MRSRLRSSSLAVTALVLLTLLPLGMSADASVVVPLADDDLIVGADVIVLGRVTRITSHEDAFGELTTYITLSLDEVLKGALWGPEVTIREAGGGVGDRRAWVSGNPEFVVGERVLLFMDQRPDGTLRTYQFYLGKFTIVTDPASGDHVAVRGVPARVTVMAPRGAAAATVPLGDVARDLDDFSQLIRRRALDPRPRTARPRPALPFLSAAVPPTGTVEDQYEFRFIGDPNPPTAVDPNLIHPRWFEPDANLPVTMRIFSQGEPAAPTLGFDQIRAALRAWNRVPTSSFRFVEGPAISGLGGHVSDGVNTISFRDPRAQIPDPTGCGGTLAITWVSWTSSDRRTVNGRVFGRMIDADVVVANGWDSCNFYQSFGNFTEVITHELGHALGLGHSADTTSDPINLGGRSGATMNAFAHFDGRIAGLHADDRAGGSFIYPGRTLTIRTAGTGSGTVRSGTDGISCPPDCVAGFAPDIAVALTPTPAPDSAFNGFIEAGCGTSVVMSTDRTCTATFLVNSATTTTAISSSANPSVVGQAVTFTATVGAFGTPTGTVTFRDGTAILGTGTLNASRQAMLITSALAFGSHSITAQYSGDPSFGGSTSAGLVQTVNNSSTFVDVPTTHPFFTWIEALVAAGMTTGCSTNPSQYCPDSGITRAQMAVFLLRSIHGAAYQPPGTTGMFTDVSWDHPFARWIEQLGREGITGGCAASPPRYCPDGVVTRGEMAVFLLRARHGAGYNPPARTGMFTDVPSSHPFAAWIEQLAREGITAGCGPTTYCPDAMVTRGQMAVFLVRAFTLPM